MSSPSAFHFPGLRSPPRRPIFLPSPTSPFCTSPSQLQEVTLDPDASFAYVGMRSPSGPMRGRSVKEFEEQLTSLRKENFNLKLRIYFLEERMGPNFNMDQENAVKKNIELMVELESLRKELQEKQELLCQAVKAMELEEDEHKKDSDAKEAELQDVKNRMDLLQAQYELIQEDYKSLVARQTILGGGEDRDDAAQEVIKQLEHRLAELENEKSDRCESEYADVKDLEAQLQQVNFELESKNCLITESYAKLTELEAALEDKMAELATADLEVHQKSVMNGELMDEIRELRQLYDEAKTSYEQESTKNERNKQSIMNRNLKIAELEGTVEKYKARASQVELKLQTVQNEVKSKSNPTTPRASRGSSANSDQGSFSVRGSASPAEHTPKTLSRVDSSGSPPQKTPTSSRSIASERSEQQQQQEGLMDPDLARSKQHIAKLEQDQMKACRIIKTMVETRKKNSQEIKELQTSLEQRDLEIQELKDKLGGLELTEKKSLQARINELNLTAAAPASDTEHGDLADCSDYSNDLLEQYKLLTGELDTQKQILTDTLKERCRQMYELERKYEAIVEELKMRDNHIVDLEFELLAKEENMEKSDIGNEKASFWLTESAEKDKEIDRLEKELARRTSDLQTVVNKELWEKNREIERLQLKFATCLEKKDVDITQLKKDIANRDNQLTMLKEKISEMGERDMLNASISTCETNTIKEKLKSCFEERHKLILEIDVLQKKVDRDGKQLAELVDELAKSERLRTATSDVCSVLSVRLEELGQFMNALLRQKSVLGFLGSKQGTLRKFVNQSLDLSRSLSMSITMNADQSLLQLSNISDLLETSRRDSLAMGDLLNDPTDKSSLAIIPDHITLTYQSHLNIKNADKTEEQAEIIQVLRTQIEHLKREVELRDNELAANKVHNDQELVDALVQMDPKPRSFVSSTPSKILENLISEKLTIPWTANPALQTDKLNHSLKLKFNENSDSESWSEPDRSVSKARIGPLSDLSLKPVLKQVPGNSESTEVDAKTRSPSKKSQLATINALSQQILQLELKLQQQELHVASLQETLDTSDTKCKESDSKYREETQKLLDERDSLHSNILRLEQKLAVEEEQKRDAQRQVEDLHTVIENLQSSKMMLKESMDAKSKLVQNKLNEIECDRDSAQKAFKVAEQQLGEAKAEVAKTIHTLRMKEKQMQDTQANLEGKITLMENEFQKKMMETDREYENKVKMIELQYENQIEKISKQATVLKTKYETEYVKRTEVDRLVQMIHELESVKDVLHLSEDKVQLLEESEGRLKHKLKELERDFRTKLAETRRELDDATLKQSQVLLEKTRSEEERSRLENELSKIAKKEKDFVRQVDELKSDFNALKAKFQKQLDEQKAAHQAKVKDLEMRNADLKNRLVRSRTGRDGDQPHSAPTSPCSKILDMYFSKNHEFCRRQISDTLPAGYVSEGACNIDRNIDENVENERMHSNSSPDLGIESDHGRFSSLEANTTLSRPFLQSLEVTESMNVLLDKDQNQMICDNDQCCGKSKEIQSENNFLRRKLHKTNKLLEDTVSQLAKANQRKKEVEKNICKQIHKTSQVLRKAKANLDSGSDSELLRM